MLCSEQSRPSVSKGKTGQRATGPGWHHLRGRGGRAEALAWLGARAGAECVSATPGLPSKVWDSYLQVLLFLWHSKLSNRHSAVLHSSSHWLLMYSQQRSEEVQLAQGSSIVREQSPPSHWQA